MEQRPTPASSQFHVRRQHMTVAAIFASTNTPKKVRWRATEMRTSDRCPNFLNVLKRRRMNDRHKQILATLAQMDKQFGKGSVLMLGSRAALPVEVISTGSVAIDSALGAGGFPRGRVVEVFGPESSGKTTLALQVI